MSATDEDVASQTETVEEEEQHEDEHHDDAQTAVSEEQGRSSVAEPELEPAAEPAAAAAAAAAAAEPEAGGCAPPPAGALVQPVLEEPLLLPTAVLDQSAPVEPPPAVEEPPRAVVEPPPVVESPPLSPPPAVEAEPVRLPRRVAVITGGTSGIGLALACSLLSSGEWDVVIGARECRPEAAERAAEALRASLPPASPPPAFALIPLELCSSTSIADFASAAAHRFPAVHALYLNAAVGDVACGPLAGEDSLTEEGLERTFASNYAGHYALVARLLPALRSGVGRVVAVSCDRHRHAWQVEEDDWQRRKDGRRCKPGDAYNDSKVLLVLFALKLQRALRRCGVSACACDPGVVPGTRLLRDRSKTYRFMFENVASPLWAFFTPVASAEEAAAALLAAAADADGGGCYFEGAKRGMRCAAQCRDEALQDRLFADTARLLGITWPDDVEC